MVYFLLEERVHFLKWLGLYAGFLKIWFVSQFSECFSRHNYSMMDYMDYSFELYTVAIRLSRGTDGLGHDYCEGIDYYTLQEIRELRIYD